MYSTTFSYRIVPRKWTVGGSYAYAETCSRGPHLWGPNAVRRDLIRQLLRQVSALDAGRATRDVHFVRGVHRGKPRASRQGAQDPSEPHHTAQTLIAITTLLAGISLDLASILLNGSYHWGRLDSITLLFGCGGTALVFAAVLLRRQSLLGPLMLTGIAIAFKAVPQLFQAAKIFMEGNQGVAGVALATGHVTASIRVAQLFIACREAPRETNRHGAFIAELANELSWVLVTIAWLLRS